MVKFDMMINDNDKIYLILKVNTDDKQNIMNKIINDFILRQNKNINEKHYIGIDFEFNKVTKMSKEVALMQINLENDFDKGFIFIVNPNLLNKKNIDLLISLLTNKYMIKILHGAESLDIPYLFNQFLITEENINYFCNNFYDTKYLCDYYHLSNNITSSCSIYNLLLEFNIINQNKLNELNKNEESMGPIYLIEIDINKMDTFLLKYALYDVIYLPSLLKKILINDDYINVLPSIVIDIYKWRQGLNKRLDELQIIINKMNIYFIKNKSIVLLKDIHDMYSNLFNHNIDKFKKINYFKNYFELFEKLIIYHLLTIHFKVYINKNIYTKPILHKYIHIINSNLFLKDIFNDFNQSVFNDILKIKNQI